MHLRFVLAFGSFALAMAAVLFGNICWLKMVSAINSKRSPKNRIFPFGWISPTTFHEIVEEYRAVIPDGRLHICFRMAAGILVIVMLIFAVSIGFAG